MANNKISLKELKAFETVKMEIIALEGEDYQLEADEDLYQSLNIIETALNECNGIKSSLDFLYEEFNIKDFADLQKHLKSLEIIKEIDKTSLLHFIAICVKDQEKYDLLKKVLENE